MYFHLRFPAAEIVAVEMMPDNAAALHRLAALNGLPLRVVNVAVGDQTGEARVRCNQQHTRHSLVRVEESVSQQWGFTEREIVVPVTRMGRLLDEVGWDGTDLLKIDIEGAEQLLLNDLAGWAGCAKTVFMEIHHNVRPVDAVAAMEGCGYRNIGGGEHSGYRTELWFARWAEKEPA